MAPVTKWGNGIGIAYNPEFLREGSAVSDFWNPSKTIVASEDPGTAQTVLSLYRKLPGPFFTPSVRAGEMIKYTDNAFHALQIAFAKAPKSTAAR